MRKVIFMLLSAFVGCSAAAEWVRVGSNDTANLIIYANPDSIHRAGNKVSMWNLLDFTAAQRSPGSTNFLGTTYLSVKAHHEYDCEKEQQRILAYYWYSKNMGNGNVVFSDETIDEWIPVHPYSTKEILLKYACGKN